MPAKVLAYIEAISFTVFSDRTGNTGFSSKPSLHRRKTDASFF
jgi:hypothetical protein